MKGFVKGEQKEMEVAPCYSVSVEEVADSEFNESVLYDIVVDLQVSFGPQSGCRHPV